MNPKLSIIIPVYNSERWLSQTIESCLNQVWENIEILIVDDGSSDDSVAIANRYASEKVKVVTQPNQGASGARSNGLKLAKGDFIQYLDADDLLAPTKISDQIDLLEKSPPNYLAICGTMHFFDGEDPDQGILENSESFIKDTDDPVDWLIHLLGGDGAGGMVPMSAWLTPRAVADKAGFWAADLNSGLWDFSRQPPGLYIR